MSVTQLTIRSVDIDLGGNRTLRVTVSHDQAGVAESLVLADGFGRAAEFMRPGWHGAPLVLPAAAIQKLRDALDAVG